MKVEVKAKDSFSHGPHNVKRGDTFSVAKAEAEDLEKRGLVEIGGEAKDDEPEKKVAPISSNKMEPAPENKAAPAKPAGKK